METFFTDFYRIGRLVCCGVAIATGLSSSVSTEANSGSESVSRDGVYRVEARSSDGGTWHGSAVAIGNDTLVTNCHVTRRAVTIDVMRGSFRARATLRGGSGELDLCVLTAEGIRNAAPRVSNSGSLSVGDTIHAVGFPSGQGMSVSTGVVKALHRHEGANVIQVTASFEFGASGGALFDRYGNLVGVLTFKMLAGETQHYAVPADWIARAQNDASTGANAFWERRNALPQFLQTAGNNAAAMPAKSR